VDQVFGYRIKDLRAGPGGGHVVIDIGAGLLRAHGRNVVADADAVHQSGVARAFELIA